MDMFFVVGKFRLVDEMVWYIFGRFLLFGWGFRCYCYWLGVMFLVRLDIVGEMVRVRLGLFFY